MAEAQQVTLLEHLKKKFDEHVDAKELPPPDKEFMKNNLASFLEFSANYLNKYRPAAINHKCEMNYLITLQDREEVLISPPYKVKAGTMAQGKAVSMSTVEREASLDDGTSVRVLRDE